VLRASGNLVMAWFLSPEVFGVMTLVKVFLQGLQLFSDVGIRPSIIRSERGHDPTFLNTAWTLQLARGVLLSLLACLLAWPYAWWYARSDPAAWQLAYLLPVAGLTALLGGLQSTSLATLSKEMRLEKLTALELSKQVVTLVAIVVFALIEPSAWAVVLGTLTGGCYALFVGHRLDRTHRNRFAWDADCAKELLSFGSWVFLSTMFTFLAGNLDRILLGGVVSLAELGLYGMAAVFSKVALDVALQVSSTVMLPVYSKLQGDVSRLMKIAVRARRVALCGGGVVCISLAVLSPLVFETLWDERYHQAGQLAQWMALYTWSRILVHSIDRIPLALGNSRALFVANVIQFFGVLFATVGYAFAGMSGFIVGMCVGPLASHCYVISVLPGRRRQLWWQSVSATCLSVLVGGSMCVGVNVSRASCSHMQWVALQLCCCIAVGCAALWALRKEVARIVRRQTVREA